jgi:hypothetical protein
MVVKTEKRIDYLTVADDVVVYRLTMNITRGVRAKGPKVIVSEGITSTRGLSAFRNGADHMPPYRKDRGGLLVEDSFREMMRASGWVGDDIYKAFEAASKDPYTRFVEGKATAANLVFVDASNHMTYDIEGEPLPTAVLFTYIEAHMDNGHYDLEKALAILKARDDIRFVGDNRWTPADQVANIPGYNAEPGRDRCIGFVWMPKVEDYRRMLAKCAKYKDAWTSMNRYRAVFDLDILGLRAGGAAKLDDFYARVPDPPEREEGVYASWDD